MMLTEDEAKAVCTAARWYKGVPWRGQGRDFDGIDCVGLIVMAYRGAGFDIDEGIPNYRRLDAKRLVATLSKYCDAVADGRFLPGDVVVYETVLGVTHVGLVLDDGRAMHVPQGASAVETRFDPKRGRIRSVYRWRS